jgi:hypothetical protein
METYEQVEIQFYAFLNLGTRQEWWGFTQALGPDIH